MREVSLLAGRPYTIFHAPVGSMSCRLITRTRCLHLITSPILYRVTWKSDSIAFHRQGEYQIEVYNYVDLYWSLRRISGRHARARARARAHTHSKRKTYNEIPQYIFKCKRRQVEAKRITCVSPIQTLTYRQTYWKTAHINILSSIVERCGASVMCRDWCRMWSQFQQEGVMDGHSLTRTVSAETRVLCRLRVAVTRCDVVTRHCSRQNKESECRQGICSFLSLSRVQQATHGFKYVLWLTTSLH